MVVPDAPPSPLANAIVIDGIEEPHSVSVVGKIGSGELKIQTWQKDLNPVPGLPA